MNIAFRLLIALTLSLGLQACVVFTFTGEGAPERVPTADVPAHLASALLPDSNDRATARRSK
jgi:hypothetical protein